MTPGIVRIAVAAVALAAAAESFASESERRTFRREFGPVTAVVEVSADRITVGDALECRFIVDAQDGVTILSMPNVLQNPGNFVVLDYSAVQTSALSGGGMRRTVWFKLDPTLPGQYAVLPQEIRFVDRRRGKEEREYRFETPEAPITVTGLIDGAAEWSKLKGLRGTRRRPVNIPWMWILAALAAAGAAIYLLKKRRRKQMQEKPKPADLIADIELDRLMRENLIDRGQIEAFVTRLSGILRQYIENRFRLRAPRRTTEEFYDDLKGSRVLNDAEKQMVIDFLRQADLVKFAAEWVDRDRALALLDTVRTFVRRTREGEVVASRMEEARAA